MKWLVSIHRIDAYGAGFNDNWADIEAEDEMAAINEALTRSLDDALRAGTHLTSIHVGTPRPQVRNPANSEAPR